MKNKEKFQDELKKIYSSLQATCDVFLKPLDVLGWEGLEEGIYPPLKAAEKAADNIMFLACLIQIMDDEALAQAQVAFHLSKLMYDNEMEPTEEDAEHDLDIIGVIPIIRNEGQPN